MCNRFAKCGDVHVVGKPAPAVDLDDREPFAIFGLEGVVAGDVHLAEREAELGLERPDLRERPLAEMTALCVVDDDVDGYG